MVKSGITKSVLLLAFIGIIIIGLVQPIAGMTDQGKSSGQVCACKDYSNNITMDCENCTMDCVENYTCCAMDCGKDYCNNTTMDCEEGYDCCIYNCEQDYNCCLMDCGMDYGNNTTMDFEKDYCNKTMMDCMMKDHMMNESCCMMEMDKNVSAARADIDCADYSMEKAVKIHKMHLKNSSMVTEESNMEMMDHMMRAYECITGENLTEEMMMDCEEDSINKTMMDCEEDLENETMMHCCMMHCMMNCMKGEDSENETMMPCMMEWDSENETMMPCMMKEDSNKTMMDCEEDLENETMMHCCMMHCMMNCMKGEHSENETMMPCMMERDSNKIIMDCEEDSDNETMMHCCMMHCMMNCMKGEDSENETMMPCMMEWDSENETMMPCMMEWDSEYETMMPCMVENYAGNESCCLAGMNQNTSSAQVNLCCASFWLKQAIELHEMHMKYPSTSTRESNLELMYQMIRAHACITGKNMMAMDMMNETMEMMNKEADNKSTGWVTETAAYLSTGQSGQGSSC